MGNTVMRTALCSFLGIPLSNVRPGTLDLAPLYPSSTRCDCTPRPELDPHAFHLHSCGKQGAPTALHNAIRKVVRSIASKDCGIASVLEVKTREADRAAGVDARYDGDLGFPDAHALLPAQAFDSIVVDFAIAHPFSHINNNTTRADAANYEKSAIKRALDTKLEGGNTARICARESFEYRTFVIGAFGGLERTHGLVLLQSLAKAGAHQEGGKWYNNYKGLFRHFCNNISMTLYRYRAHLILKRIQHIREFNKQRSMDVPAFGHISSIYSHQFLHPFHSVRSIDKILLRARD